MNRQIWHPFGVSSVCAVLDMPLLPLTTVSPARKHWHNVHCQTSLSYKLGWSARNTARTQTGDHGTVKRAIQMEKVENEFARLGAAVRRNVSKYDSMQTHRYDSIWTGKSPTRYGRGRRQSDTKQRQIVIGGCGDEAN